MRVLLIFVLCAISAAAANYDWLFRNARVVDGTGNPWFYADVAVADGRIAAVGRLTNADADHIVDAAGRVLAPGFIDVHTHIEGTVAKVPGGDNFVLDGVTTVVTGNCGSSRTDLAEWFDELEQMGLGLNVASLIGHNSVRALVMGAVDRDPTGEELDRMRELVDAAMDAGAVGLSTGLIYLPGLYAKTGEVVALAKVASSYGGVYATHMRSEGSGLLDAIEESIQIGRQADIPVEISHFKVDEKKLWGLSKTSIEMVEKARRDGIDVVVDQYPYDRSSTSLQSRLPGWALEGGRDEMVKRIQDPETRTKIVAEMAADLTKQGFADLSFATIAGFEPDTSLEGKTISEVNLLRKREPTLENEILTALEIVNQGYAQMVYHTMSEEDVDRIMRYPDTAVASDGGTREFGKGRPHPRSYGTNARVLARYVRDRNVLRLEDAIRRMTSLPARTFHFDDRGQIRVGAAADLVLFDPDEVNDNATFEDPHRFSSGFGLVLVNGSCGGRRREADRPAVGRGSAPPSQ